MPLATAVLPLLSFSHHELYLYLLHLDHSKGTTPWSESVEYLYPSSSVAYHRVCAR